MTKKTEPTGDGPEQVQQMAAAWKPGWKPEPIVSDFDFDPATPRYVKVYANDKGIIRWDTTVYAMKPVTKEGTPCQYIGAEKFKLLMVVDLTQLLNADEAGV